MNNMNCVYSFGTEKFLFKNIPDNKINFNVIKMYFKTRTEFSEDIKNKKIDIKLNFKYDFKLNRISIKYSIFKSDNSDYSYRDITNRIKKIYGEVNSDKTT